MYYKKDADANFAAGLLNDIILERYLIKFLPKNRQYSFQAIKKSTGYNFLYFRDYVNSELFTINKTTIDITDDERLLSKKSKSYCERLIKKLVFPANYKHDKYIYHIGRLFDNSYYSKNEKVFINLMLDELLRIINDDITIRPISRKDLLKYNLVFNNGFSYVARDIFNAIIRNELHVGDNLMPYIMQKITDKKDISEKLESSSEFDYFFNKNAVLQCDLDTNFNLLIKNFLNLSIYNFQDIFTRVTLLVKLHSKYSFLIRDKIFYEFE